MESEYSGDPVLSDYLIRIQNKRSSRPPASCPHQFLIVFKFSCKPIILRWLSDDVASSPVQVVDVSQPRLRTVVPITLRDFISCEDAHDMIQEALRNWPIWGQHRSIIIRHALKEAREAVVSMPASHSHVHMDIDVIATHVYGEEPSMDEEDVRGAYEVRMVPCDDSSIGALVEKKVVMSTTSDTCSVCLEEFLEGSEAVSMPCQHLFHQDCIVKWLRTSHYCPLCRFKMPATDENVK